MQRLTQSELAAFFDAHPQWQQTGDVIVRHVRCAGFGAALGMVVAVGVAAERADHHPDIDIRWNTVTFALTTHDAGGLTTRDLELAAQIDVLAPVPPPD